MKFFITLFIILMPFTSVNAEEYNLTNPPKTMVYNVAQATYYYNVSGGCTYLYTLQYKHSSIATFLNPSDNIIALMKEQSAESRTWMKLNQIMEGMLIKEFGQTYDSLQSYKFQQFQELNDFFASNIMSLHPEEYITRILGATNYCIMNRKPILDFIDLATSGVTPEVDKPKKRM